MVVCKLIPLILSLKMNRSWVGSSIGCVPIDICARRLGVSIDTVDKIESGRFDEPQIDLELLILYLALYDEKFHLSFEGD